LATLELPVLLVTLAQQVSKDDKEILAEQDHKAFKDSLVQQEIKAFLVTLVPQVSKDDKEILAEQDHKVDKV
jgi:uncharacterized FlgJ-related protein